MIRRAVILLAVLFLSTTSYSQWEWLNPKPNGYTGAKILFTDAQTGFILNSNGDLLTTINQGGNWNFKQTYPGMSGMDIHDSTGILSGFGGYTYISSDNGNNWQLKNTGVTDNFSMADIVSRDTIFLASINGKILRSDNRGITWQQFDCSIQISSVDFINSKTGYAGGSNRYILKTEDGGATWKPVVEVNTVPSNTTSMHFIDINTGYAFREHSDMLITHNGGKTWQTVNVGDYMYDLQFIDTATGYGCGEDGAMYKTIDGGQTWNYTSPTGRIYFYDLYSICFLNADTGFTVGARGRILKTMDGGVTWTTYSPTYIDVSSISIPEPRTAYATIANNIYKTTDSGQTWNKLALTVGTNYAEYDVFQTSRFFSADTGFVTANDNARIYKTYDGGVTWKDINPTTSGYDDVTCLQFLDKNTGFLAINIFYAGTIVKTINGGESWAPVWQSEFFGEIFNKIYFNDEKTGYASRYNKLYKTTDSAKSWTPLWEDEVITAIWFTSAAKGFVTGENGMLKQTTDSGKTWTDIDLGNQFYDDIYTIKFFNEQVGYLTVEGGFIYKTINSGKTWKKDGRANFFSINDIEFSPDSSVYVAGQYGSILRSGVAGFSIDSLKTLDVDNCKGSFYAVVTTALASADSVWFEYGSNNFNQRVLATPAAVSNSQQPISAAVTDLLPNTTYNLRVAILYKGQYRYSDSIFFATNPLPLAPAITSSGGNAFCEGDSVTLTSAATLGNQWYFNNTLVNGATGKTYIAKQAGKYQLTKTEGCYTSDTSSITLTVNPLPAKPTITAAGNILTSSAPAGNQWYANGTIIAGATATTYTPLVSGLYTVKTTVNNCQSVLSDAYNFTITAINSPVLEHDILMGPNPVKDQLAIKYTGNATSLQVTITDLWGRQVYQSKFTGSLQLNMSRFTSRVYIVHIENKKTGDKINRLITKL